MKNVILIFALVVFAGSFALSQSTPARAKTPAKKKSKSVKRSRSTATSSRYRQLSPTPDRYKEIQQALVAKGYLKSQPSGVWDAQSADALRQFQTDQKLSPTGKLSSASLIALGLGPKDDHPEAPATVPKPPQPPESENPPEPRPADAVTPPRQ
jgi:hypothetical protein